MTKPSAEASRVQSAYRPLPPGPSPRWRRAAQGLRWMRYATVTSLALHVAGAVVGSLVASDRSPVPRHHVGSLLSLTTFLNALDLLANVALAAGLWRLTRLPASTGAAPPARASFGFFVAAMGVSLFSGWLLRPMLSSGALGMGALSMVVLLRSLATIALHFGYLGMLVRALGTALRAVGEARPAWAPRAVVAFAAWKLLSIPLQNILLMFQRGFVSHPWLAISLAADAVFAVALVSMLRQAEGVLARQESPEPA